MAFSVSVTLVLAALSLPASAAEPHCDTDDGTCEQVPAGSLLQSKFEMEATAKAVETTSADEREEEGDEIRPRRQQSRKLSRRAGGIVPYTKWFCWVPKGGFQSIWKDNVVVYSNQCVSRAEKHWRGKAWGPARWVGKNMGWTLTSEDDLRKRPRQHAKDKAECKAACDRLKSGDDGGAERAKAKAMLAVTTRLEFANQYDWCSAKQHQCTPRLGCSIMYQPSVPRISVFWGETAEDIKNPIPDTVAYCPSPAPPCLRCVPT